MHLIYYVNIIAFLLALGIVSIGLPLVDTAKWLWGRSDVFAAAIVLILGLLTFLSMS
jgi:hypothetical protein